MKAIDLGVGIALALLAGAVLWTAQAFPVVPGQQLGAGLLPELVGPGLRLCGIGLVLRSLRDKACGDLVAAPRSSWRDIGSALLILASIAAYVALADKPGFLPVAPLCLLGVFRVLRVVMAVDRPFGNVFTGMWALMKKYPLQLLRGSALGTLVGALPGAGADIAAWMSYAMSKRFSTEPEKFGTGHVEGIVESGAANNSALGGAWIPAPVFGIPGDSITAIAIGVLCMKNMNPGPMLFVENPQNIHAVFIVFILAQLLMLPLGWMAILAARRILRAPAALLMPLILLFCIVGSFAINNTLFGVVVMGVAGVLAFFMERWGFPVAPTILGVVLGTMLEEHFFSSLVKADGQLWPFFERPIAGALGALVLLIWLWPPGRWLARRAVEARRTASPG